MYDWAGITSSAYLMLLELEVHEFPISARKIKCKDVVIASYQKYAELTGVSVEQISMECEFDDALLLRELRPGLKLILYNKNKYDARLKHTLFHEIGHIKRNHKKHGENEEIEAHFFAAQTNAPNAIVKAIADRGYVINKQFLIECFGLSEESAKKKMKYLGKYEFRHKNEFDDILLSQFSNFVETKYPIKNPHYFDDDYEEQERERQSWR